MSADVIARLRRCAAVLDREAAREQPAGKETLAMLAIELRDLAGKLAGEAEGRDPHPRHPTRRARMSDREPITQTAPYPYPLRDLVGALSYREDRGWRVWLQDTERDPGSRGLTLIVQRCGPDTYHPENIIEVNHYFPVPPATYNERSWRRWLFDRLGDVDTHERMEDFIVGGQRPYAPAHGPGNNPYLVLEYGTDTDRRTSFRGVLDDDGTGRSKT